MIAFSSASVASGPSPSSRETRAERSACAGTHMTRVCSMTMPHALAKVLEALGRPFFALTRAVAFVTRASFTVSMAVTAALLVAPVIFGSRIAGWIGPLTTVVVMPLLGGAVYVA